ncbi:superoxide dismutase [Vibrio tapetis]|uniref:Superoxide dismutase n=2 Tax=Vibrio tapetis TaxID=52443 RepID=A0A2N8ZLQ2_9VIBR|nr:superoxide dismutase [Vibrio tapetis]AIY26222.1 superoxide dismutase Mn/Fe 2 [Vibrio tapetis]SON52828.1 Superoxide dismutase [Mn/Fe] 2 [Vibrio tapetis subsp. tapetis]
MSHQFPELPYGYSALEPYIDAKTMEVHYSKHHRTYFDKFTAAIAGSELESQSLTDIFANISKHSPAVRNNGGGYYNHILYWNCMSASPQSEPSGKLASEIERTFGELEAFKRQFSDAAINTFGSGFAWLVVVDGELQITSTSNQDNPLMDVAAVKGTPILALDVWEHAYYISYQNRRPDYINAWWQVVDWKAVEAHYQAAL